MKKIIISAFALAAISTGAFASGSDHGGNGMDSKAFISNTEAFAVAPITVKKTDADTYLNMRQLR